MFNEDKLKEMEKYAAEMKVVKFTMWLSRDTKPVIAVLQGISRSAMIEDLAVRGMYVFMNVHICKLCVGTCTYIQFYISAGICI